MIDLHYWPTPNGHKITLLLEELAEAGAGLEYTVRPVNIGQGDQFRAEFLEISPNNKMPAIVDHAPADGGAPLSVFESGAILLYLAGKTGRFLPSDLRAHNTTLEWLFWQMAGLGPMTGQYGHFHVYAPEQIDYAKKRYAGEANRLLGVLNHRLEGRRFIVGDDYTIADMSLWGWVLRAGRVMKGEDDPLERYPNIKRWFAEIEARPAAARAREVGKDHAFKPMGDEESRKALFPSNYPPAA